MAVTEGPKSPLGLDRVADRHPSKTGRVERARRSEHFSLYLTRSSVRRDLAEGEGGSR